MDDDDIETDHYSPEALEAREVLGRAITDYLRALRPDAQPYVVAWVVGAEWTNAELEQTNRAGRDVVAPMDQTISASAGLGGHIAHRYT